MAGLTVQTNRMSVRVGTLIRMRKAGNPLASSARKTPFVHQHGSCKVVIVNLSAGFPPRNGIGYSATACARPRTPAPLGISSMVFTILPSRTNQVKYSAGRLTRLPVG